MEEERLRARRLQNERDVQQASAMSHKEKERQIKSDLENEKKKRAQLEQKLEKEREKNTSLNKELNERDTKLNELRQDFETQSLKQSEKVSTLIPQMGSLFAEFEFTHFVLNLVLVFPNSKTYSGRHKTKKTEEINELMNLHAGLRKRLICWLGF